MAHTSVYGIFATRQDAEMAIDSMRASGFLAEDISVLFPDNEGTKDIGHEKHTKAPERATAGAAIAGIAGGALGWLAGLGILAIRDSARLSQPVQSWEHWPALEPAPS